MCNFAEITFVKSENWQNWQFFNAPKSIIHKINFSRRCEVQIFNRIDNLCGQNQVKIWFKLEMIYNDLLNMIAICLSNKFSGIRGNDNTQTWIPHPLYVLTIKKSRACFYPSSLKQVQLASILVGNKFGSWQFHLYQILNLAGLNLALVCSCFVV